MNFPMPRAETDLKTHARKVSVYDDFQKSPSEDPTHARIKAFHHKV